MSGNYNGPFLNPEEVYWPGQFVSYRGCCLLSCGAFEQDEAPFGFTSCHICRDARGRPTQVEQPRWHLKKASHLQAQQDVRRDYAAWWQELTAPDRRPYFYDHVSHTWTFERPACKIVSRHHNGQRQGVGPAEFVADLSQASQVTDHEVTSDEQAILERGPASTVRAPRFSPALASPWLPDARLDCQQAEQSAETYWFNPKTRATAWTQEELVDLNQEFYKGVSLAQASADVAHSCNDQQPYWVWKDDMSSFSAWDLEELYSRFQSRHV